MKSTLISIFMIAYCAWNIRVELPEHRHPVILLGNIPVRIVHKGGLSHDFLSVIVEGNGKVCLFPVKMIKSAHTNQSTISEKMCPFSLIEIQHLQCRNITFGPDVSTTKYTPSKHI